MADLRAILAKHAARLNEAKSQPEHPTKKGYFYDPELSDHNTAGFTSDHGEQTYVKRSELPKDHPCRNPVKESIDEAAKKVTAASAHKYAKDMLKHHGYVHHSNETTTGAHKSWFDGHLNHSPGAHETVAHHLGLKQNQHFPDEYEGKVQGHYVSLHKQGSGVLLMTHKTANSRAGIDEEVQLDEAHRPGSLVKVNKPGSNHHGHVGVVLWHSNPRKPEVKVNGAKEIFNSHELTKLSNKETKALRGEETQLAETMTVYIDHDKSTR